VRYCIQFAKHDGVLRAVVSGRASPAAAASIARDIAAHSAQEAAAAVLVDVRRLANRIGSLRALLDMPKLRVAVLDDPEHDPHYVFTELAARLKGRSLRYFDDARAAVRWLNAVRDPLSLSGDRKWLAPGGGPAGETGAKSGG
jgi:hypothetical protein